jgi:hypothetical protein
MIGYKAFDMELKCRGFQFEVGKTYDTGIADEKLELCTKSVFHFCREINRIECVSGYKLSKSRVCEVVAEGSVVSSDDGKFGTNRIMILRELTREEIEKYGNCNSGNRNSGNRNSGDWNSGNRNSGNRNSGDRNSGDWNSGNRNSGNWNSGNSNSGNWNSGNCNSGNRNSGDWNSGNWNSGNWNSGNRNSGDWNSGNNNSGNSNSGNRNSGDWNSGNRNSGNWNSGNWNSGDCNSGNWNSGNSNSGYFNVDSPLVRIFGKETDVKKEDIDFPGWLYFGLTQWVSHDTATDKEKKEHKNEIEISGGFLKTLTYKEAFRLAWRKAEFSERKKLFSLPNWNNEIFMQISGIDAEKEIAEEEK